ncbi:hypothetical protein P280DRAFT_521080 [Massarina eburnea CBS 473.64]|uniref:Protein kinase domain-containing protein n=1 Tax=Massarina eburnea CBS 473.64 TaxID=1395130 RepID=A0A6A6RPV5_9PLEO|nr:hypothetical protein P280DRAFT_521080 [Massarina eburnea CBS 473.64]
MASQGGAATNFDFNTMNFAGFSMSQTTFDGVKTSGMDNTYFGDEGIDTTTDSFGQQFDPMFLPSTTSDMNGANYGIQSLGLDNTSGNASWGNTFPLTPAQSFNNMCTPQLSTTSLGKRPLHLDIQQDFPQAKRHEGLGAMGVGFSPYAATSASATGSSWAVDTLPTPSSSTDVVVGLSDEAADVCATWFSKYNVLPSDRHIDSLSQLTAEPATAIRHWFGQALKTGMGHDSAYKSQTSGFTQEGFDPLFQHTSQSSSDIIEQSTINDLSCFHDLATNTTTTSIVQSPQRGGKKGCNPTNDPELLSRDPNKIYQCTRKCGKRYGRKCDWKRNEEEGYPSKSWMCSLCIEQGMERVKPAFRKYHFAQHFRNLHPGLDCNDYEEASVVYNDTAFPRKCGFCAHRFESRQDRIDHIAEHFKKGKCMLDWNDDDSNDSDNTDNDDDNNDGRPDSGDFSSDQFYPPGNDHQQGGSSSSKRDGSGSGGQQHPKGGFFQFHLQQFASIDATGASPGNDISSASCGTGEIAGPDPHVPGDQHDFKFSQHLDSDARDASTGGNQHIKPTSQSSDDRQRISSGDLVGEENRSVHGKLQATARVDENALARNALPQSLTSYQKNGPDSVQDHLTSVSARDVFQVLCKLEPLQTLLRERVDPSSRDSNRSNGNGVLDIRTMNALLALLNPTRRQPPLLPPPLPSPDVDIGDMVISKTPTMRAASLSSLVPEHLSLAEVLPDQGSAVKPTSSQKLNMPTRTMLQVRTPPSRHNAGYILTAKQQYWQGPTALLDQQSFLSIKLLGTGGFSTVDEVVHRETNLRISRKTLKNRQPSALEEIQQEVRTLQKLRHPHVIRYLGVYSKGDKMCILLTPVAETTLAVWLDQKSLEKPSGLAQTIVKMLGCLSSTIRYLHEQRPVVKHMDIKPQNILVMQGSQEFPHVVLSDFGISSTDDAMPDSKHKPLTRQYCAPEVSEGISREKASDIWSLGCVFAEMTTVAFSDNNQWREFRSQFLGRKTNYYCQDIPALQDWLTQFVAEAPNLTEATVVSTVKSMLSPEPSERPDAAMLTMVFSPAPCCFSWPNKQASFPGPLEEIQTAEMLVRTDNVECQAHLHSSCAVNETSVKANVHYSVGRLEAGSQDKADVLRGMEPRRETDRQARSPTASEDVSPAKQWLHECSTKHFACQQPKMQNIATSLPTRLVDIRPAGLEGTSVRIVNSSQLQANQRPIAYAAISYSWGPNEFTLSVHEQDTFAVSRTKLSQAVNEAIVTAERIGYRYIWIDTLCVQHDSASDKMRECHAMADVYRNADLTLVLPNDSSSTGTGCRGITEKEVGILPAIDFSAPGFAWDTRAWTLQERLLSHRLLYMGEQLYWECNTLKASETFPRGMSPLLWEKVHTKAATAVSDTAKTWTEPDVEPASSDR